MTFFCYRYIKHKHKVCRTDGNSELELGVLNVLETFCLYSICYGNIIFKFRLSAIEVK